VRKRFGELSVPFCVLIPTSVSNFVEKVGQFVAVG
jgi:hypothetical protein